MAAAIGIGVAGAILGLAGLIFGVVIFLRRKKSKNQGGWKYEGDEVPLNDVKILQYQQRHPQELGGPDLQELSAVSNPVELPADSIDQKKRGLGQEERESLPRYHDPNAGRFQNQFPEKR